MATKKKADTTATPAKKTAKKTADGKKPTTKSKTVKSTTPKTKPTVKKADFKPLPFKAPDTEKATVVMPNGQTVKRAEMVMLLSILRLENGGRKGNFDAVKLTNSLLNVDTKGNDAWLALRMFLEHNK